MLAFFNYFIYSNSCVIRKNFGWLVYDFLARSVNLCNSFLVVITGILYQLLRDKRDIGGCRDLGCSVSFTMYTVVHASYFFCFSLFTIRTCFIAKINK